MLRTHHLVQSLLDALSGGIWEHFFGWRNDGRTEKLKKKQIVSTVVGYNLKACVVYSVIQKHYGGFNFLTCGGLKYAI
jgi:hypothetical protein